MKMSSIKGKTTKSTIAQSSTGYEPIVGQDHNEVKTEGGFNELKTLKDLGLKLSIFDGEEESYLHWRLKFLQIIEIMGLKNLIHAPNYESASAIIGFEEKDRMLYQIIVLSVSDKVLNVIDGLTSGFIVWRHLEDYYNRCDVQSRVVLLKKLVSFKHQSGTSMENHIHGFSILVNKLASKGLKIPEEMTGILLLSTLPEEYNLLGSMLENETITMHLIKSRVLSLEQRLKPVKVVMAATKDKKGVKCFKCGKKGHFKKDCKESDQAKTKIEKPKKGKVEFKDDVAAICLHGESDQHYQKESFVLDSGATTHIVSDLSLLEDGSLSKSNRNLLSVEANRKLKSSYIGNVVIYSNECKITLTEVMVVPDVHINIISVKKLIDAGCSVVFRKDIAEIKSARGVHLGTAKQDENGLFVLEVQLEKKTYSAFATIHNDDCVKIHRKFGHVGMKTVNHMFPNAVFPEGMNGEDFQCDVCIKGKSKRNSFGERIKSEVKFERIHSDVCGPFPLDIHGNKYFVSFIDERTRFSWIYLLKKKEEVFEKFSNFKKMIQTQFDKSIRILRSDGGGEYKSKEFEQFMEKEGMVHEFTAPYSPQQNGIAERKNRSLLNITRCMLLGNDVSKGFWSYGLIYANLILNLCYSHVIGSYPITDLYDDSGKRHEMWMNRLQEFGSKCLVHVQEEVRVSKLDSRAQEGIFLGLNDVGNMLIWNAKLHRVQISRDVVVLDSNQGMNEKVIEIVNNDVEETIVEEDFVNKSESNEFQIIDEEGDNSDGIDDDVELNLNESFCESSEEDESFGGSVNDQDVQLREGNSKYSSKKGYSRTVKNSFEYEEKDKPARNYIFGKPQDEKRKSKYRAAMLAKDENITIPQSYSDALKCDAKEQWKNAMQSEYDSLVKNGTFELVDKPKDGNVIDVKWVFALKKDDLGNIVRYKARLVARGFKQIKGLDFDETFAPVINQHSIHLLFWLAIHKGYNIHQMDVNTAFLYGTLEEDIYVKQPPGFIVEGDQVWKLRKSLYGLKQSPRIWNKNLKDYLISIGFKTSRVDDCIFISKDALIGLYVDDLIICGNDEKINWIKDCLNRKYDMKDLGKLKHFLKIKVDWIDNGIQLSQGLYIKELLEKYGMSECKTVNTPFVDNTILKPNELEVDMELQKKYRSAVGSLLYLRHTRPDISFSVGQLSMFVSNPSNDHWIALKRVLRYLKGTMDFKMCILKEDHAYMNVYVDSSWGNTHNRRSVTGFVIRMGNSSLIWKSKVQPIVSLSSTESEYIALAQCGSYVKWVLMWFKECEFDMVLPVKIYCDNQSCIDISENPVLKERSKHIDIKYYFVRDMVQDGTISMEWISTEKQLADIFTKGLSRVKFELFYSGIRND